MKTQIPTCNGPDKIDVLSPYAPACRHAPACRRFKKFLLALAQHLGIRRDELGTLVESDDMISECNILNIGYVAQSMYDRMKHDDLCMKCGRAIIMPQDIRNKVFMGYQYKVCKKCACTLVVGVIA